MREMASYLEGMSDPQKGRGRERWLTQRSLLWGRKGTRDEPSLLYMPSHWHISKILLSFKIILL